MADRLERLADLVTPMAVRVAATLRIADHLRDEPRTAAALAEATTTEADALDRVLRHLVAVGVLTRDGSGRYGLTDVGDGLRSDHPGRLRDRLDVEGPLGRAELAFVHLLHSVRTGEAAFPVQFGRNFWDDLASDPDRSEAFDAAMGGDVAAWAPAILGSYDWASLGHVVDVGGGDGTLLATLLGAHPALRGTVVDLPGPAERARATLEAAGLTGRAGVVVGSFFEPLPPGADAYVLTAIVHDWDDDAARAILRRCLEAAGDSGKVLVVEKIGADGTTPGTWMDLRLLVHLGGQERSLDDLVALAESAGARVLGVHPAGGAIVTVELAG